ncbi:putative MFS transporter superfamily, biopterin transporter family [Helianthus annuus]|nr:putative MFS transporter superfamily, biopterin transporter family [Helianthus annuus]
MYLSMALSISTHEAVFYWYTDPNAGPAFSQELIGMVYAIGALASIGGTLIYQKVLKDYPFRKLLFFAQLVYSLSGFIDLMFVLRASLCPIGIEGTFFALLMSIDSLGSLSSKCGGGVILSHPQNPPAEYHRLGA